MKRSQTLSFDIMLAIVLFISTIVVFYVILNLSQDSKAKELEREASIIARDLTSGDSEMNILDENRINLTKLERLLGDNYSQLKQNLRVRNDFCIYFEDENGNVIYINDSYTGTGAEIINVGQLPCGKKS
jgi:sensor histidine kinase regulating citrate/malate metabolism